jgi:hypothetical protein
VAKNHHTPTNINTECQWTQLLHQKTRFGKLDYKGISFYLLFTGNQSHCQKTKLWLRVKGWKNIYQTNGPPKQAGVAILISDKVDFKLTLIK